MWQKNSGEKIDGAVAIDPTAIGYLLEVTGPARLSDGQLISSDNVAALTQKTLYQRYPDTDQRKAYLLDIASDISEKLISAHGSSQLIRAGQKAASQRRLLVWSADESIESTLRRTDLSGTVEPGSRPFAGFTTTNATGGKLDYYLQRSMTYSRTGCATATTTSTFRLTNAAPPEFCRATSRSAPTTQPIRRGPRTTRCWSATTPLPAPKWTS